MRARYLGAFELADLLDDRAVELVMITVTPPGIVTLDRWSQPGNDLWMVPEGPPKNAKMRLARRQRDVAGWKAYDTWDYEAKTWREAYIWLFSKMRKTAWWRDLGIIGGIWAYEGKQREPGEWISCARPCCRKKNAPGVLCPYNGYGRYAKDEESHPHLHIVARKLIGDRWPTGRECARRITEYTKANGFGYARVDKRHGNLRPTVAYATKYVTKDTGGGGRTKGVFGNLYGKITANDSTRRSMSRYE